MSSWRENPTIDQLLNDPITLAVMRADRVDPDRLRAMLRAKARLLGKDGDERRSGGSALSFSSGFGFKGNGLPLGCCGAA